MGEKSKIGWTDHSFNGWIGCKHVSPGCAHCYAEALNSRMGWCEWGKNHYRTSEDMWKKPLQWNEKYPGEKVFCESMGDFLDEDVPYRWRHDLWDLIIECPNLWWLMLTKRPENWPLLTYPVPNNVWFGVSVENKKYTHRLLGLLVAKEHLGVNHTFISFEPLLGDVGSIEDYFRYGVPDWIIIGGESGPKARPMDPKWADDIIFQAKAYHIPIFVKQLGGHPDKREDMAEFPDYLQRQELPEIFQAVPSLGGYQFSSGEKRSSVQDTDQGEGKSLSG